MAANILLARVTRGVGLADEVVGGLGRMASGVSYKCCVKFVKVVVRVAVEHKNTNYRMWPRRSSEIICGSMSVLHLINILRVLEAPSRSIAVLPSKLNIEHQKQFNLNIRN